MPETRATLRLRLRRVRPIGFVDWSSSREVDVLIDQDGRVARVAPDLEGPADRTVDLGGAWLSPGWADLHVHIYHGATDISVRARQAGAETGVTTLVDAGSAGEANFVGFREYVAEPAREEIYAFLNIGSIGLVACNRVSELIDDRSIDVDRMLACVEANRDLVRGIKVRASGAIVGAWGAAPARIAKTVARVAGLPMMVHIGEMPPTPEEILSILEPGDIITHCFHGKRGASILDDRRLFDHMRRLSEEGVILDIGHGFASFSFEVGRAAIEAGLRPDTISTDLHLRNVGGPVWDLATTMSKLLALGLPLEEVVAAVTRGPRRALGGTPGEAVQPRLSVGERARFTAFSIEETELDLPDALGARCQISKLIRPRWAVLDGALVEARSNREAP